MRKKSPFKGWDFIQMPDSPHGYFRKKTSFGEICVEPLLFDQYHVAKYDKDQWLMEPKTKVDQLIDGILLGEEMSDESR